MKVRNRCRKYFNYLLIKIKEKLSPLVLERVQRERRAVNYINETKHLRAVKKN